MPYAAHARGDTAVYDGFRLIGKDAIRLFFAQQFAQGKKRFEVGNGICAVALDGDLPIADAQFPKFLRPFRFRCVADSHDLTAGIRKRFHHIDPKPKKRSGKAG